MKKLYKTNYLKTFAVLLFLTLVISCGGGGEDGSGGDQVTNDDDKQVASNPDFMAKAKAVNFSRIKLFSGHINAGDRTLFELDPSSLNSGELITIEVEFEITGNLEDYSLAAQLLPESVFKLLNQGDTLGEIVDKSTVPAQGIEFIDLGGVYIDEINSGILHGFIHAKLPVLETDSVFKIAISPSLQFLAAGIELADSDVEAVPVLVDERELTIHKLEQVAVKIKKVPDLSADNDFTELEINSGFDENGFSAEPVFQTSIEVDLTTFNTSEDIALSINYVSPNGSSFPMALLSSDIAGNPLISEKAQFKVNRSGVTSAILPLVAYAPLRTYEILLKQSTHIKDIADQPVENGSFQLQVFFIDNGAEVISGDTYNLSLPLVRQDNRFKLKPAEEATGFTVLRAGNLNNACLRIDSSAFDIDTGLISSETGFISKLVAAECPDSPSVQNASRSLWRYDITTKQIISKEKDINGDNHCITWIDNPVIPNSALPVDFNLLKCRFEGSSPDTAISPQRFIFEDQKIRLEIAPVYVDVIFTSAPTKQVTATLAENPVDVVDIFRNTNGVDVDQDGRLFYIGKFYDRSWGSVSLAKIDLSYGGESYLDYMPVLGSTSEGHSTLTVGLFGAVSADLVDANFALKRYFPKKISINGNNTPDVVVGNGASFTLDFFGLRIIDKGEIVDKNITETFDPLDDIGNVVLPEFLDLSESLVKRKESVEFVSQTIIVAIIPVTITGGVEGTLDLDVKLSTPDLGVEAKVIQDLKLSGFLNAKVLIAGIEGTVDALNQKLTFAANAGFEMNNLEPKLSFNAGSSLLAELNLLKGTITAFVDYPKPCLCLPPFKIKHAEEVIYESDYLFNDNWTIFDEELNPTIIEY